MNTATSRIAKQLREIHFGGNWTGVNLRDKLADVSWQEAAARVFSLHSIATLVFHMNYYVSATVGVLHGGSLDAKDRLSFDGGEVQSADDWERLTAKTWADAETLAALIESLDDSRLADPFVDPKYGTYYRCLQGPVAHCHYHLGQIAIIKTLVRTNQGPDAVATASASS